MLLGQGVPGCSSFSGLSPGKSPGSGWLCCTGFMHCHLLGNGKNCSACLVQQCKCKRRPCSLCPGPLLESWSEDREECGFRSRARVFSALVQVLVSSGK